MPNKKFHRNFGDTIPNSNQKIHRIKPVIFMLAATRCRVIECIYSQLQAIGVRPTQLTDMFL
jgi:hypothetical protein